MFELLILNAGLSELVTYLINNWLGPAYLITVAFFAIMFLKDREFRKLAAYVVIATVVAILIYAGNEFLGKDGTLTKAAKNTAKQVSNVISLK